VTAAVLARTRFDQAGKQLVREALQGRCSIETDAEVPAEHMLALPVLRRLRLTVPIDSAQQTRDDQEFLMDTQDIVETWRREAIQEGLAQGERKLLMRLLQRRFGLRWTAPRSSASGWRPRSRSKSGPSGCCRLPRSPSSWLTERVPHR